MVSQEFYNKRSNNKKSSMTSSKIGLQKKYTYKDKNSFKIKGRSYFELSLTNDSTHKSE